MSSASKRDRPSSVMEEDVICRVVQANTDQDYFVLAGPACGKSFFCHLHPETSLDVEDHFHWATIQTKYRSPGGTVSRDCREWEWDMVRIFFEECVPVIVGGLDSGRLVLSSVVNIQNVWLVSLLLEGFECKPKLLRLDANLLEERFRKRCADPTKSWYAKCSPLLYEHMGWSWTFSVNCLLAGVAQQLGLPSITPEELAVMGNVILPEDVRSRVECMHRAEWIDHTDNNSSHTIIELMPHVWGEFVNGQLKCTFKQTAWSKWGMIDLDCTKTSYLCNQRHGSSCSSHMTISKEAIAFRNWQTFKNISMSGVSFSDFIDTRRISPSCEWTGKKLAVVSFYGSLAPIHRGHLDALETAKHYLISQNYHVLGGYVCPLNTVNKAGVNGGLKEWRHRASMVKLHLRNHSWLMLDGVEGESASLMDVNRFTGVSKEMHPIHSVVVRLANSFPGLANAESLTVFWVNGADASYDDNLFGKLSISANTLQQRDGPPILKRSFVRMLIVPGRDGKDQWEKGGDFIDRSEPQRVTNISSSSIRKKISERQYQEVISDIGNKAAAAYFLYLQYENERNGK